MPQYYRTAAYAAAEGTNFRGVAKGCETEMLIALCLRHLLTCWRREPHTQLRWQDEEGRMMVRVEGAEGSPSGATLGQVCNRWGRRVSAPYTCRLHASFCSGWEHRPPPAGTLCQSGACSVVSALTLHAACPPHQVVKAVAGEQQGSKGATLPQLVQRQGHS